MGAINRAPTTATKITPITCLSARGFAKDDGTLSRIADIVDAGGRAETSVAGPARCACRPGQGTLATSSPAPIATSVLSMSRNTTRVPTRRLRRRGRGSSPQEHHARADSAHDLGLNQRVNGHDQDERRRRRSEQPEDEFGRNFERRGLGPRSHPDADAKREGDEDAGIEGNGAQPAENARSQWLRARRNGGVLFKHGSIIPVCRIAVSALQMGT